MPILANYLEMVFAFCSPVKVVIEHILMLDWVRIIPIYVIKDRVLNASKAKTAIENSSAIISISLSESRVLVELRENFI